MENYALALANYFVELAAQEKSVIRPLKLMKLVYIAHGYMLALLDRPTDGAKLEAVQAWKYGPVFPSVYYSFNQYGRNPIERQATTIDLSSSPDCFDITTPCITNADERAVCRFVWNKYAIYTDSSLVSILHAEGTPWSQSYQEGKNMTIPDELTKTYYKKVISDTLNGRGR